MVFSTHMIRLPSHARTATVARSSFLHYRLLHLHQKTERTAKCGSINTHPTFSILEKCSTIDHLRQTHAHLISTGFILMGYAASQIIASVMSLQSPHNFQYCLAILNNHNRSDTIVWNSAIRVFADGDDPKQAILIYKGMLRNDVPPDNYTYPFVLKGCGRLRFVGRIGQEVHAHVVKLGFDLDVYVQNALIHVNCACGRLEDAKTIFNKMSQRDLVSWNSMIDGCVRCGWSEGAIVMLREMEASSVEPDVVTMICIASACAQLGRLDLGNWVHEFTIRKGIKLTTKLCNALMDMHVKCGNLDAAEKLFVEMPSKTVVSWTTMVVGYSKHGLLSEARRVFDEMPEMDIVPWNAMLAGYVQCKYPKEALSLFRKMQSTSARPNEVTMSILLSCCAQLGALDMGKWVHHYIDKHKICYTVELGTALVDMYAKCGDIGRSLRVFHEIPVKNALTWTAMITGLAGHGYGQGAISIFLEMIRGGYPSDDVTFLGVLSACCHNGLVEEGRHYFAEMSLRYNLTPKSKHCACMVDLLGRAGLLSEALELIVQRPAMADKVVWGAFFSACKAHRNMQMGELAASRLIELDPDDCGIYVLLANMYADAGMLDKATKARKMMKERGIEKTPGCSLIEVNGIVNEFTVRDKSHPKEQEIYACLLVLAKHVYMVG